MKPFAWFCALILFPGAAPADPPQKFDWPQWQGPDRNAISKEHGLLKTWPKEGPPLAWKAKGVGGGYSAPSIAAGLVFGMGDRGNDEVVWALAEKDGKEAWAMRIGPVYKQPAARERGTGLHADGRRRVALCVGPGRRLGLPAFRGRRGRLATSLSADFGGKAPPGAIANRPWSTATKSSARPAAKRRPWSR